MAIDRSNPATTPTHRVPSTQRQTLIRELVELQQGWPSQDILTITGFMNDEEVAAHVSRYRKVVR